MEFERKSGRVMRVRRVRAGWLINPMVHRSVVGANGWLTDPRPVDPIEYFLILEDRCWIESWSNPS